MIRHLTHFVLFLVMTLWAAAAEVLIVADEFPAMEFLATQLKSEEHLESRVVKQTELPSSLQPFRAVIVYLHGRLLPGPEMAFIEYTRKGGRLIALHHSVSSGKRTNEHWFSFLGVKLPPGNAEQGGYQWIEPATLQVVKLGRSRRFLTSNRISWPETTEYRSETGAVDPSAPAFTLHDSEVYLNHVPQPGADGEATHLHLGFKYTEAGTGKIWMQDRAGWHRREGQGYLFYFQPGHSLKDFEHPTFLRLVLNAVVAPLGEETP
jgi:hypothetical protein